jgi:Bacterial TSP3 repeat
MVDLESASVQCEYAWSPSRSLTSALGLIAVGALGVWLAVGSSPRHELHAATASRPTTDLDGDGLADALELRLGTASDEADTDGDGISDAEEVARGSLPTSSNSTPNPDPLGVGLQVYQTGGPLQLVSVFYIADGNLATKTISMGARVGSVVRTAPVSYFTKGAKFTTLSGSEAGSSVLVIDAPVQPQLVQRFGSMSFFTTLANQGKVSSAGVVNVAWKGLLLEYIVEAYPTAVQTGHGGFSTGRYEPIDPSAVPTDWTPDAICAQGMTIAASVGPVVIQEVVEASCETGWDAYCDPGCSATVGSTVETLDPGALIGG